jgi:hypothetical protein
VFAKVTNYTFYTVGPLVAVFRLGALRNKLALPKHKPIPPACTWDPVVCDIPSFARLYISKCSPYNAINNQSGVRLTSATTFFPTDEQCLTRQRIVLNDVLREGRFYAKHEARDSAGFLQCCNKTLCEEQTL